MDKQKALYPRLKVRIRFGSNHRNPCTDKNMLKGILPALWDPADHPKVMAAIGEHVRLYNSNHIFFYPFPLDLYRTRFLDKYIGGYQHFPWEMPDDEILPICEICRDWDFNQTPAPVKPFFTHGSAQFFRCPGCHAIRVDDYQMGKAGMTLWLTAKQFKEKYPGIADETLR